jgi:hypothetical protein
VIASLHGSHVVLTLVLKTHDWETTMEPRRRRWLNRIKRSSARTAAPALFLTAAIAIAVVAGGYRPFDGRQHASGGVMLILRGVANAQNPHGQLDDEAAREYARRLGYRGEVLDVAGDADGPQTKIALDRIHHDDKVTAIYGFSGGGYNARRIWSQLKAEERHRIGKVVVIGSPGVSKSDFPGSADVLIKQDPPAGHMAGPRALLDSLDSG